MRSSARRTRPPRRSSRRALRAAGPSVHAIGRLVIRIPGNRQSACRMIMTRAGLPPIMRNRRAEWVDVTTGLTSGSLIEVFGNLQAGDQIAVRGTDEVRSD